MTRYAKLTTVAESEVSDLKSAVSALQEQMATMAMGQQAAFFGQQHPPPMVHINKKQKTPCEGATEQPWVQNQQSPPLGPATATPWSVPPAWRAAPPMPQQQWVQQQ